MIETSSGFWFVVLIILMFALPMSTIHAVAVLRGRSPGDWRGTTLAGALLGFIVPILVSILFATIWEALGQSSLWEGFGQGRFMYVFIVMGAALGLYGRQRYSRLGFGFAIGSSLLLAYALFNELSLVVRGG